MREANAYMEQELFKEQMRGQLQSQGIDPDLFSQLADTRFADDSVSRSRPGQPTRPVEPDEDGGGFLGKVAGFAARIPTAPLRAPGIRKVAEPLFGGAVQQPWDLLRPLKRFTDWEAREVGQPILHYGVGQGLGVPLRMAIHGESPEEASAAVEQRWKEDVPDWLKEVGGGAYAPTSLLTIVTPATVAKLFTTGTAGRAMAARIPMLDGMFSAAGSSRALRNVLGLDRVGEAARFSISGGAPETANMVKILERSAELPADIYAAKSVEEVLDTAKLHTSLTQDIRADLAKYILPTNVTRWLDQHGIRLTDGPVSVLINQRNRGVAMLDNYASARADEQMRIILGKFFDIDEATDTVRNVRGTPKIRDLITQYKKFGLTQQQEEAIRLAMQPVEEMREVRRAYGVKVHEKDFPDGMYAHKQAIKKPIQKSDPKTGLPVLEQEGLPVVVKKGFRSKQSYTYPETFATQAEGEAAGIEYMNFFEAQRAYLEQNNRQIMDEWLVTALEPYGKTPVQVLEATEPGLVAMRKTAGDRVAAIRNLRQSLTSYKKTDYAARGYVKPFSQRRLAGLDEDVRSLHDQILAATQQGKKAARKETLTELLNQARTEETQASQRFARISGQRRLKIEQLRGGTTERPRAIRGRLFEEEPGRELEELVYGGQPPGAIEKALVGLNDTIRPVMATLDASFMGVQGLVGLSRNPAAYAKALLHAFSSAAYDGFYEAKSANGTIDSFINHGGHWAARNDLGEFMFTGKFKNLPGVKQSNTWFTHFGNSMRTQLYEAGMSYNRSDFELQQLAKAANLATGYSSNKVTTVERAALFAPRFFRSQFQLASMALAGGKGPGANEARRSLISLIGGGAVLTYGINTALGEETDLDPNSPNFMRIRALGKDISVFGPWDTFVKAMIKEADGLDRGNPTEGLKYLAMAKAAPGIQLMKYVWQGETYGGGKLDWSSPESALLSAGKLAASVAPISIQSAFEEGIPTTPQAAGGAAVQFLGTKATPLSGGEKRQIARDEAATKAYGLPWSEIEEQQQYELLQANPNLQPGKAESETARAWESFRAIGSESNQLQEQLDSSLAAGPEWVDQYKSLRERVAGRYLEWEKTHPEIIDQLKSREIKDPEKQARIDYINAFKESRTSYGALDADKLAIRLDALESSWTPQQQAYVDRNTGFKATDRVKAYRQANRTLQPYWEVENEIWDYVLENRPELRTYPTFDDYHDSKVEELRQLGVPQEALSSQAAKLPMISAISKLVSDRRIQVRMENPKIDAMVALWYGATPLAYQERFQASSARRGGKHQPRRPRPS